MSTPHTSNDIIGAHMSALLSLRARSLEAYGIDPHSLMTTEQRSLVELPQSKTRSLAKISRESRALAVESEHAIMVI